MAMFIALQNSWKQAALTSQYKLSPAHHYLYYTLATTLLEVLSGPLVITGARGCIGTIFISSTVEFGHFFNNFPKTYLSRMISLKPEKGAI